VLAIIGVVFIVLAILFFAGVGLGPLNSVGHSGKVNHGSHGVRGAVSIAIGVIAFAGAWFTNRKSH